MWLARTMAGIPTPPFAQWDMLPRRIRKRVVGVGDVDPPSNGSSEPSSADETSTQG
jgi:hypothetical protein